jgi:hypothetical protein
VGCRDGSRVAVANFETVESYLQARVFGSGVTMTHRTRLDHQTSLASR